MTEIKPRVVNCPGFVPLHLSRRRNICPCGFRTGPLGVLCKTSGVADQCQEASKNLAPFDA